MGILGDVKLVQRSREVTIGVSQAGEEIKVRVTAPPLQLVADLRQKIPDPKPPTMKNDRGEVKYKTNPRTGDPIKEEGQLVPMLNYLDEGYLTEASSTSKARTIAMIFHCAEFPGTTEVDKKGHTAVGYELARWRELEEAGCDVGAFTDLSEACVELSQPMTKIEIEDARCALGTDAATQVKVKEALGHSSLSTTMLYTHLVRENLNDLPCVQPVVDDRKLRNGCRGRQGRRLPQHPDRRGRRPDSGRAVDRRSGSQGGRLSKSPGIAHASFSNGSI